MMAVLIQQEREAVRSIEIIIGKERHAIDFGREIPRSEAWERARLTLETMK